MKKDLVLFNGNIHTMDKDNPVVKALVVRDGWILYAGNDNEAQQVARANMIHDSLDLKGATVVPGLTDAHLHLQFISYGLDKINAELPTKQAVVDEVAKVAAEKPEGAWITGFGWNHNVWDGEFPTAADLDAVAPNHPVVLDAKSGHATWVNSMALKLAKIDAHTPDPAGGEIVRDARGNPTGALLEEASAPFYELIPEQTVPELMEAMRKAIALAHQVGLTCVHDMDRALAFSAEQELLKNGELTLRVIKAIPLAKLDEAIAVGLRSGFGNDMLRIGAVKMFADGAMGPHTALMLEGYENDAKNTGIPATPIAELSESVFKANAAGLATAIHAIGDRGVREVLDIYEEARDKGVTGKLRNRIEHVQLLSPQDMNRLGELGVIASMQPIHTTSDMYTADKVWGKRSIGAYALKSQLKAGAVLALGSDCPVEVWDPLVGIHAAVTRRRANGEPGPEGWHPEEKLTVEEAVEGFTVGPAYAAGMEDRLGKLKQGYLADCVILDADIFSIDPMEIPNTKVLGTVVDGRFVWRAPEL